MIIVIEGADLVGKTTVINRLTSEIQNSIPLKLKVVVDLDRNCLADIERSINLTAYSVMDKTKDEIWIVDRFIVSALIYSKFLNRPCKLSIEDIKARDYTIIILGAKDKILKERFQKRNDTHFSLNQIMSINKLFFNFFSKNILNLKNLFYYQNNNQNELENIIQNIKAIIELRKVI